MGLRNLIACSLSAGRKIPSSCACLHLDWGEMGHRRVELPARRGIPECCKSMWSLLHMQMKLVHGHQEILQRTTLCQY